MHSLPSSPTDLQRMADYVHGNALETQISLLSHLLFNLPCGEAEMAAIAKLLTDDAIPFEFFEGLALSLVRRCAGSERFSQVTVDRPGDLVAVARLACGAWSEIGHDMWSSLGGAL